MAAAPSCDDADLMVIDDLDLIALCQETNQAGATALAMSDEDYALELQLQEVMVSSAMAAAVVASSLRPHHERSIPAAINDGAVAGTPVHAVAEGSCSSPPPLAAPAAGEDASAAATWPQLERSTPAAINDGAVSGMPVHAVVECSCSSPPPVAVPAAGEDAAAAATWPQLERSTPAAINDGAVAGMPDHAVVECSCSSPRPLAAPAAGEEAPAAATSALVAVAHVICKICLDYMLPSDMHRASGGCTHAFCAACLTRYISAKIQDSISVVKCPAEDCESVLDPEFFQGMLPKEAFEAWDAALCRSIVLKSSNVCYCPFNDCSEIMVDERGGGVPESECPVCRRLFCAQCGVPWHAGISCAEYEQLAPGDRGMDDMVVLEMAKGKKWRRCPRCKFLVEKHDGCVHITCRCSFEFCYGCGEQWTQSGHSTCHAT